jgi:tetratricopeptide (TPR) repeat protein
MRLYFTGLFLLSTAWISGCVGIATHEPESLPVSDNNAVSVLANTARVDAANGNFDAAVASLERALRIEPRNPALWQELAKLRLQQGQYQQAEGLAAKSNGWAADNKTLRAENWRIIGQARLKRGDYPGAQSAFDLATKQAK